MGNIIVGVLLLLVGFWMYSQYAPQWQQAQSFMGQLAQTSLRVCKSRCRR